MNPEFKEPSSKIF